MQKPVDRKRCVYRDAFVYGNSGTASSRTDAVRVLEECGTASVSQTTARVRTNEDGSLLEMDVSRGWGEGVLAAGGVNDPAVLGGNKPGAWGTNKSADVGMNAFTGWREIPSRYKNDAGSVTALAARSVGRDRFQQPHPMKLNAEKTYENAAVATRRDITSHGAQGGTEHVKEKLLKVLMDGGERAILVSDLLQEKMEKRLKNSKVPEHCKFCRNNFEEDIYHQFKDSHGRVVCPVLSKHVCELCGARGPAAHTRKYCPYNPLTRGEPERLGFPPGMMPVDVLNNTLVKLRDLNLEAWSQDQATLDWKK